MNGANANFKKEKGKICVFFRYQRGLGLIDQALCFDTEGKT